MQKCRGSRKTSKNVTSNGPQLAYVLLGHVRKRGYTWPFAFPPIPPAWAMCDMRFIAFWGGLGAGLFFGFVYGSSVVFGLVSGFLFSLYLVNPSGWWRHVADSTLSIADHLARLVQHCLQVGLAATSLARLFEESRRLVLRMADLSLRLLNPYLNCLSLSSCLPSARTSGMDGVKLELKPCAFCAHTRNLAGLDVDKSCRTHSSDSETRVHVL
eukprot:1102886-Amphidinium_carterae.1